MSLLDLSMARDRSRQTHSDSSEHDSVGLELIGMDQVIHESGSLKIINTDLYTDKYT